MTEDEKLEIHRTAVELTASRLQDVMRLLDKELLPGLGLMLLTFPLDGRTGPQGHVNYIGNCQREDMLVALKEVVARWEGRAHAAPERAQ